jgi:nicotinamidase-related amidase
MPLTRIDPNAALIVIDLQKGFVGLPTVHPVADIIDRSARLAREFRQRGLSVVLVNVSGRAPGRTDAVAPKYSLPPDWSELVGQLDAQPTDHLVTKQRWGAFAGTNLDDYLRGRGVTQVFITGVATSVGVESTARSAYDLGYNVVIVVDAMTDRDPELHRHRIEKIFPRLSETETTSNILKALEP